MRRRAGNIFNVDNDLDGVDLRVDDQLALLESVTEMGTDLPFPIEPDGGQYRYHFDNHSYSWGDGTVLHALLRHINPARIIEVGSGYSSAMILDTAEGWLDQPDHPVEIRFIEPYPQLLRSVLRPEDRRRVTIDEKPVQDVSPEVFSSLGPGDVLFIDSTHVAKAGSDVNYLFFEVLPHLAPGVWVHFHDIFLPFEYPEEWVMEGRAWNEAYLLRAFLMYNSAFKIRWFQNYLWMHHQPRVESRLPTLAKNPGGNIWLQRS